jgi:hypothetical protein
MTRDLSADRVRSCSAEKLAGSNIPLSLSSFFLAAWLLLLSSKERYSKYSALHLVNQKFKAIG